MNTQALFQEKVNLNNRKDYPCYLFEQIWICVNIKNNSMNLWNIFLQAALKEATAQTSAQHNPIKWGEIEALRVDAEVFGDLSCTFIL